MAALRSARRAPSNRIKHLTLKTSFAAPDVFYACDKQEIGRS